MYRYIIKRILLVVPTLLGAAALVFLQMSPGMRRISRKTSAAAPSKVGTTSSIRFTM